MKHSFLSSMFTFLFLILSLTIVNAQRVVSTKTEPQKYAKPEDPYGDLEMGSKTTTVTADDLGVETVTEETYDKNDNLIHKTVIRKSIDGDKVLTTTTDTQYNKRVITWTRTLIRDQSGKVISGQFFSYDKDAFIKSGGKLEVMPSGDFQEYKYIRRTNSYVPEKIWEGEEIQEDFEIGKDHRSYNLPFPKLQPDKSEIDTISPPISSLQGFKGPSYEAGNFGDTITPPASAFWGIRGGVNLASLHVGDLSLIHI